jgi:CRISPR-associated protein Csm4
MSNKKTYICYLHPEAGYRPELRSDTLWGLICWGIRLMYGEKSLTDFLASYSNDPELTISSAFPFKRYGKDTLLYFPLPFIKSYAPSENSDNYLEMYRLRKDVKKVRWVNQSDFNKVLKAELTEEHLWERAQKAKEHEHSQELVAQSPPRLDTQTVTHNTIDRINLSTLTIEGGGGQLFHIEERFVVDDLNESSNARNTGLYFLAEATEDTMHKIAAVLRFYRFNGLGGDRSTGKGTFQFDYEEFDQLETPQDANMQVSLSLYHPTDAELNGYETSSDNASMSYLLERRSGRIGFWTTNMRKDPMLYFKEGSVFPLLNQTHYGMTPALTAGQHNYYSYGHAFMVKMKI